MSRDILVASARTTLAPTPDGARLRKRVIALAGLIFMVLGFLVAVGLAELVLFVVLGLLAAAGALGLIALVRRYRDVGTRALRPRQALGRLRESERRAFAGGVSLASRHGTKLRRAPRAPSRRTERNGGARQAARLNARGSELRRSGDLDGAIAAHTAACELARAHEDKDGEALALNNLALALGRAGNEQGAIDHLQEAATILRDLGDEQHEAQVVANLGLLHARSGRREEALSCLEAALGKLDQKSHAYRRVEEQLRRAS